MNPSDTSWSPFAHQDRKQNHWRKWSTGEDAKLRAEVATDERLDQIALQHQRTLGAVWSRMKRLNLEPTASQRGQLPWALRNAKGE